MASQYYNVLYKIYKYNIHLLKIQFFVCFICNLFRLYLIFVYLCNKLLTGSGQHFKIFIVTIASERIKEQVYSEVFCFSNVSHVQHTFVCEWASQTQCARGVISVGAVLIKQKRMIMFMRWVVGGRLLGRRQCLRVQCVAVDRPDVFPLTVGPWATSRN